MWTYLSSFLCLLLFSFKTTISCEEVRLKNLFWHALRISDPYRHTVVHIANEQKQVYIKRVQNAKHLEKRINKSEEKGVRFLTLKTSSKVSASVRCEAGKFFTFDLFSFSAFFPGFCISFPCLFFFQNQPKICQITIF